MNSPFIAAFIAAAAFACGLAGLAVHRRLPEHHVSDNTRDLVKLIAGLIATMSALVLSLMISTSAALFNTESAELQMLSVHIIQLDNALRAYGPGAEPGRVLLKNSTERGYEHIWGGEGSDPQSAPGANVTTREVPAFLVTLKPTTDTQQRLLSKALELADAITEQRLLMSMQIAAPVAWPFLSILVSWGLVLFFGFGLLARANGSVIAALAVGSCALASAIFLILELGHPYSGLIRIPPAPVLQAIEVLNK